MQTMVGTEDRARITIASPAPTPIDCSAPAHDLARSWISAQLAHSSSSTHRTPRFEVAARSTEWIREAPVDRSPVDEELTSRSQGANVVGIEGHDDAVPELAIVVGVALETTLFVKQSPDAIPHRLHVEFGDL